MLLWDALPRWPHVVELYSAAGLPLPLFPGTASNRRRCRRRGRRAVCAAAVFAGRRRRSAGRRGPVLLIAFGLSAWLGLLDVAGTMKKYSVIGLHLLLLLAFTQSHAVWSLDAWLAGIPSSLR